MTWVGGKCLSVGVCEVLRLRWFLCWYWLIWPWARGCQTGAPGALATAGYRLIAALVAERAAKMATHPLLHVGKSQRLADVCVCVCVCDGKFQTCSIGSQKLGKMTGSASFAYRQICALRLLRF